MAKKKAAPAKTVPNKAIGRIYSSIGLACAILSLLILPIIFGPAAIILGILAKKNGDEKFGQVVFILGIVFMVVGMILGAVVNVWLNWDEIAGGAYKVFQ
jgi:hypothetical protein